MMGFCCHFPDPCRDFQSRQLCSIRLRDADSVALAETLLWRPGSIALFSISRYSARLSTSCTLDSGRNISSSFAPKRTILHRPEPCHPSSSLRPPPSPATHVKTCCIPARHCDWLSAASFLRHVLESRDHESGHFRLCPGSMAAYAFSFPYHASAFDYLLAKTVN